MKKKTKLPLAVAETVQKDTLAAATTPPLKKAELITALVERARIKHEEERAEWKKKVDEAEATYCAAVLADYEDNSDLYTPSANPWRDTPELTIIALRTTPALTKLRKACCLPGLGYFSSDDARKRIRDAMNGNSAGAARIQAVLNNPETVKALDATLEAIDEISA